MTTFLFVLFTISFFISAPFYTANIPQVARFVNNNLFEFSDFIRLKRLKRAIHCLFIDGKDYVLHEGESIVMPAGHPPPTPFSEKNNSKCFSSSFSKKQTFHKKSTCVCKCFFDLVFAVCQAYSQSSISVTVNGGSMCVEM